MFKNIVPFVLALFVSCSLWGQIPREIQILPSSGGSRSSMMCDNQDAGNISFAGADMDNQSNDVRILSADEPIFLCWGDRFFVQHDQSTSVFDGSPSAPGVGYAFYTCRPTQTGPTLMDILDDPCTLRSLRDMDIPLVSTAGRTTGNATFSNEAQVGGLSLQEVYNNGDPEQYWFTPITYDNIDLGSREAIYEMDGASCVNSDTSQVFSVVYLNPISVNNINTGDCGGELTITGGFPEFNNSEYTVDIVNANDNTIIGAISGNARHGDVTTFTVPSVGEYIISITDNKACTTSQNRVDITSCNPASVFKLEAPCTDTIVMGNRFCLDFSVSNFNDLISLQFQIDWDSTIAIFESITPSSAAESIDINSTVVSSRRNDNIKLGGWLSPDILNGSSLPDNTILFTACFIAEAAGNPNFRIEENLPTDPTTEESDLEIEVIDFNSDQVPFTSDLCPTLEIMAPPPAGQINVRTDITSPCRGIDNGQLSFSFVGGTAPYNLNLRGENGYDENFRIFGQDTIIENLAVDNYSYLVEDEDRTAGAMSSVTNPIRITDFVLNIRFDEIDPLCVGQGTGSLTAIPLIFNTPADDPDGYTYEWSTSPNDTLQTLDSLVAGTYSVTITDANGCSTEDDEDLFDPQELRINQIDVTPAQCSGVLDGSLEVNVTGGTGSKTFSWDTDPEILNSTNNLLTNLDVDDYNVTVTDDNGCTVVGSGRVNGAVEIEVDPMSLIVTDVQCFNTANGMITFSPLINVEQGGPTYNITNTSFQWSINTTNSVSNGAITIADNLGPGTYEVTITNSDLDPQCFGSDRFTITEPDSLMLDIDITNVTRCQLSIPDGAATLSATGGTGPGTYAYAFLPKDGNSFNGETAMNLAADSITVTVMDDNGCITELDTIIGSPAPPEVLEFDNDNIPCADGTGSLQVLASPGDAPVTDNFIWEGPSNVTTNLSLAGNLEVGKYFVTITDANDCFTVDSAEVIAPPAFEYSNNFAVTAEPCFEAEDGAFVLEVTGGTPGYTYAWFNENDEEVAGQTTSVVDVPAGLYNLRGTDGNGCDMDTTIELTSKPEIVVTFSDLVPTSCAFSNAPDGGATATASYAGGMTGEFDFIWGSSERDDRVSQSTATQLGSGNISVVVFESDGVCNTTDETFIMSPDAIIYDPTNTDTINVSCFGFDDGEISTIGAASGGTPGTAGYTFEWTHGPTGNTFIGETITDLTAGDYTLVISDENDCLSNPILPINITEPEILTAVIDTDPSNTRNVSCAGDNDGQITVIATGGNDDLGPYTYEWTNNVSVEAVATDLASNITYEIVVSDANGCEATAEYFIQEPADLNPYIVAFDPIECFGDFTNIRLDPASFSGGNGGDYTYSVDGCPEREISEASCQVRAGSIPITVYDSGGCAYDDIIEIEEPDQIVIEFPTAELDGTNYVTEVQLGGEIELNAEIINDISVPIASVMWTDTSVICPPIGDCRNGIVNPLDNKLYTIEVIDQNGCEESASILVEVDKNRNVFIPNAFAPNSRGFDLNETFKIYTGLGVRSVNFAQVFNRWGTMVADIGQINDPSPSGIPVWNGELEGQRLAQGVYVYIVSVTFVDNTTLLYRGDVTLLR